MATVSGQATTFNILNYTGPLFNIAPADTPLLSAIGGLGQGRLTTSREFEWQTEGLESSTANNVALEGDDAPTASEVDRTNVSNVCEIHHETVEVSYTKLAAVGQLSGINSADGSNPVQNELTHQLGLKLKKVAIDVELSFINGSYDKPVNNSTPRKTRGLVEAVSTNTLAANGDAVDTDMINDFLASMYDNGAPLSGASTVFIVGPRQKVMLTKAYAEGTNVLQAPMSRNVGGVAVDTLVTNFGVFGVMLDRWVDADTIIVADLSQLAPVFLDIPGKGHFFAEELARTGSSVSWQLYGEVGLLYGPESYHGVISGLDDGVAGS